MKRLGDAPGEVPQAADEGEGDELLGSEVPLHGGERRLVLPGGEVRHRLRPADDGLLLLGEKGALAPAAAREQSDLLVRDALSPTELDVVPQSVVALRENRRLDDDELRHAHVFGVALPVGDAQPAVHDLPALHEAGRPAQQPQKARDAAPAPLAARVEGRELGGEVRGDVLGVDQGNAGQGAGHHLRRDAHLPREARGFVYRHGERSFFSGANGDERVGSAHSPAGRGAGQGHPPAFHIFPPQAIMSGARPRPRFHGESRRKGRG